MLLLALLVLLPSAAAVPMPSAEVSPDRELTITSITPVVQGDATAQVRGRITNVGEEPIAEPTVGLVRREGSSSRDAIASWVEGTTPITGRAADSAQLAELPPGESASFTLEVDARDLAPDLTAGAAWVSIQSGTAALHTFVGVHRAKEYIPLDIVWGVPLLLPADPTLFDEPGTARTRAWEETVGPDSRLAELTELPPAENEVWILDPSLLALPPEPLPGSETFTARTEELELRTEWVEHLRESLDGERTIVLPEGDADVAAALSSKAAAKILGPRIAAGRTAAEALDAHADVLWPADGVVTTNRARALRDLQPKSGTPTLLTTSSALVPTGFTPTGVARTPAGSPLLVADESLSAITGGLTSAADEILARQRMIAETAILLDERPGTARTLLVVPDRGTTPPAEAFAGLRSDVEGIPWMAKGDAPALLNAATETREEYEPRTAKEIRSASVGAPTPKAVLTDAVAKDIAREEDSVATFASIRADGRVWSGVVNAALDQLTSVRWRAQPADFAELHASLGDEVELTSKDIVVSSSEVNFFADTGRLQITIVNRTDVELTNLVVDMTSQNPSFRIEQPTTQLTIGPTGRQKVTVQATALAAGRAVVDVSVRTPGGHRLTEPATLRVRMRPTGDTVYWIIGGTAVLLLGAGTWRTVRRHQKPSDRVETGSSEDNA